MLLRSTVGLVGLLFTILAAGWSLAAERLSWRDLVPRAAVTSNPFRELPPVAQSAIRDMFWRRKSIEKGRKAAELDGVERDARRQLESAGVDYARIAAQVDALLKESNSNRQALVQHLNGKVVQIPGYALPLEFSGTAVTEFLLVPYVGACIHSPPPPPNQIVHVRSEGGVQVSGLYTPVWVTGRMSAVHSTQNLTYVDGTAPINVGYGLTAERVEPYK